MAHGYADRLGKAKVGNCSISWHARRCRSGRGEQAYRASRRVLGRRRAGIGLADRVPQEVGIPAERSAAHRSASAAERDSGVFQCSGQRLVDGNSPISAGSSPKYRRHSRAQRPLSRIGNGSAAALPPHWVWHRRCGHRTSHIVSRGLTDPKPPSRGVVPRRPAPSTAQRDPRSRGSGRARARTDSAGVRSADRSSGTRRSEGAEHQGTDRTVGKDGQQPSSSGPAGVSEFAFIDEIAEVTPAIPHRGTVRRERAEPSTITRQHRGGSG